MSFFSKIGNALGKAANFVVHNPVTSTVMGLIPGGNLAKAGLNFVAAATSKGGSPSAPSLQTVSPVEQSVATRSIVQTNTATVAAQTSTFKDMLMKAWGFIKSYWYFVLPTVLIIIFVVVKFLWPKKRPVSRRRTAGAARARAAKAAKRRR